MDIFPPCFVCNNSARFCCGNLCGRYYCDDKCAKEDWINRKHFKDCEKDVSIGEEEEDLSYISLLEVRVKEYFEQYKRKKMLLELKNSRPELKADMIGILISKYSGKTVKDFVRDIFLWETDPIKLLHLKKAIDMYPYCGRIPRSLPTICYDMEEFMINWIGKDRSEILFKHFKQVHESNKNKLTLYHVLSDIDDTLITGGQDSPGACDRSIQGKEQVYPNAIKFVNALSSSTGYITFLSATPGPNEKRRRRVMSEKGFGKSGFLSGNLLDAVPVNLDRNKTCSYDDPKRYEVYRPYGERKYERFVAHQKCFPEYTYFFVGDTGQADLEITARQMTKNYPENIVKACFIHDFEIQPKQGEKHYIVSETKRKVLEEERIYVFNDYKQAATIAFNKNFILKDEFEDIVNRNNHM